MFLKRLLKSLILICFGCAVGLALLSYRAADSSWNTASELPARNWLGAGGAWAADALLQGLGAMALLIPVGLIVWGFLLLTGAPYLKARGLLLIPVIFLGCWLLGGTASELRWFKAGFGGYLGLYLTQWVSLSAWYWHILGWGIIAALLLFSFKIAPARVSRQAKTLLVLVGKSVRGLKVVVFLLSPWRRRKKDGFRRPAPAASRPNKTPAALPARSQAPAELPSPRLLSEPASAAAPLSKEATARVSQLLESVLAQFGISGQIAGVSPGPVVTLYEFEPAAGIKTSRVISLSDDIAREMRVSSVRIAVIPGSNAIGIEMPNIRRETVFIRELTEHVKFQAHTGALPLILGKDIGGSPVCADLAKMPHLLVAGTTGSGKSVAINTMILSLLYRFSPTECRLILVDPKRVELSVYDSIPHLLAPVVTDAAKAVVALKWAVREMEDRYRAMSQIGVRNIEGYNQKLAQARRAGQVLKRRVQTGFDSATGAPLMEEQALELTPLPYIVMIVDEMADLMCQCGKETEPLIQRLAQMARAVGIHLILATQRPSVDVITGIIKANFPTRISFQVSNKIDSRTILDEQGAEQLLGKGDMLFRPAGQKPLRLHGPFVSDAEVERVVAHWSAQGKPQHVAAITADEAAAGDSSFAEDADGESGLYDKAVAIVLRDKKVSISYVQRQLRIGYNRAADLIERMEAEGVISKPNIAGRREILAPSEKIT